MSKELTQFKYEQLDESTADFLRQKESNMREIVGKAYTELGRELTEAQQRLASHNKYEGVFVKWCSYLGFTMKQVYRLIDRYNLLTNCQNIEQKEFIEDLPVSLAYEISSKSSESTPAKAQAKSEVLAGDITTGKAYKERIKELERKAEQAEKQAEAERKERERIEKENEELRNQEPEVVTEYVETEPAEPYDRTLDYPYDVQQGNDFYEMMNDVDNIYKKYAHLRDGIDELRGIAKHDEDMQVKYRKADEFWQMLSGIFREEGTSKVVDASFIEIN